MDSVKFHHIKSTRSGLMTPSCIADVVLKFVISAFCTLDKCLGVGDVVECVLFTHLQALCYPDNSVKGLVSALSLMEEMSSRKSRFNSTQCHEYEQRIPESVKCGKVFCFLDSANVITDGPYTVERLLDDLNDKKLKQCEKTVTAIFDLLELLFKFNDPLFLKSRVSVCGWIDNQLNAVASRVRSKLQSVVFRGNYHLTVSFLRCLSMLSVVHPSLIDGGFIEERDAFASHVYGCARALDGSGSLRDDYNSSYIKLYHAVAQKTCLDRINERELVNYCLNVKEASIMISRKNEIGMVFMNFPSVKKEGYYHKVKVLIDGQLCNYDKKIGKLHYLKMKNRESFSAYFNIDKIKSSRDGALELPSGLGDFSMAANRPIDAGMLGIVKEGNLMETMVKRPKPSA